MMESILGSRSKEKILFYISGRNEGYAREIANFYKTSLTPIQKQLDNLENGGILISRKIGKTIVYEYNKRYPFFEQLRMLIEKGISFLPVNDKNNLLLSRKRPRRKNKPI